MILKKNHKSKSIILLFTLIFGLIIIVLGLINSKKFDVKAESNSISIDVYTDSDYLINDTTKTIFDYCSLHAKKSKMLINQNDETSLKLELNGDDDISQIIPKQFFCITGDNLYFGKEYGFFISTKEIENYYRSTVLVFNIDLDTNIVENKDTLILKVNTIFQYNYIYLNSENNYINYSFNNKINQIYYKTDSDIIVATPTSISIDISSNKITKLDYGMANKYYLKDISMGIALFNEQELNYGDVGYNALNDTGSFIIRCDYDFKASMRDGNRIIAITDEKVNIVSETINTGIWSLGWLGLVPGIETVVGVTSQLIELPSLINSWFPKITSGVPVDYVIGEKPYFNEDGVGTFNIESYYKSKAEQLANYFDEEGNPCLVKTAVIPFNAAVEGGAWYGVNDFAIGRFEISNSSQSMPINQTRLVSDIGLKIMDATTGELVMFGTSTQHRTIGDPVYKDITIEQAEPINLLPNGTNYFNFKVEYASNYTFNIPYANGIKVLVDGKVFSGSVYLDAGEHKVEVINLTEEKIISSLTISPFKMYAPNGNQGLTIGANQTYLLKVTSLAGVKQLCTNNNEVLIEVIYNSEIEPYVYNGTISPSTQISYPFLEGTYYITIRNKLSVATQINFTISDNVPTIALGTEQTITMNGDNYTYVKFSANEGGNYVISLGDLTSRIDYNAFNANNLENCGYTFSKYFSVGLNANTSYYFAVKNGTNSSNSIIINLKEFSYEWVIDDGSKTISTFEDQYDLYVGKEYVLNFKINGKEVTDLIFEPRYLATKPYLIDFVGNKFRFLEGTYLNDVGAEILAVSTNQYDSSTIYDQINLIPKLNNPVILTSLFVDDTYKFELKAAKGISQIDYTYYHNNTSVIANKSVYFDVDYKVDNNFDYVNSVTIDALKEVGESVAYNVSIKVNRYHYKVEKAYKDDKEDKYKNILTFEREILGPSFSNLFAGGLGSENDPYLIKNVRHFKNMENIDSFFFLLNDIDLGSDWCIPSTFIGKLNGNFKTVTYNISTNSSATAVKQTYEVGLFKYNRGFIQQLNCNANIAYNNNLENEFSTPALINVGAFCGINYGTIKNCTARGSIIVFLDFLQIGGFAGRNEGEIVGCVNHAFLAGQGDMGGIAGCNFYGATINNCQNMAECAYYFAYNNRSIGGIVGYVSSGTVTNCTNNALYAYYSPSSESRTLQPHMGQIIGQIDVGVTSGNVCNGTLNAGTLHTVTWKEGWFVTKKHNQAQYVSSGEIGQDNR